MTTVLDKKYRLIEDTEEAMRILSDLARFPTVGLDFETALRPGYLKVFKYNWEWEGTGKNRHEENWATDIRTADIRLMQIATPDGRQYVFDIFKIPIGNFKDYLESGVQLIAHNAKFEASFLLKYGISPINWGDTMIAHQLITAGLPAKDRKSTPLNSTHNQISHPLF